MCQCFTPVFRRTRTSNRNVHLIRFGILQEHTVKNFNYSHDDYVDSETVFRKIDKVIIGRISEQGERLAQMLVTEKVGPFPPAGYWPETALAEVC